MLLGYARGSVGDVTFSRVKGQQVQRARNRRPNNPRTEAQQLQRAKFSGARLFHAQMVSRFFRMAFEDKGPRESDYNAFMRHNVGISPLIFRESTTNPDYVVFAPFRVSSGSLPSLDVEVNAVGTYQTVTVADLAAAGSDDGMDLAEFSAKLIASDSNRWRAGDILTSVVYGSPENGYQMPPAADYPTLKSMTIIGQIILDPSSSVRGVPLFGDESEFGGSGLWTPFRSDVSSPWLITDAIGVAVIHSRNTAEGLRVSSQEVVLSPAAEEVFHSSNYGEAATSWVQSVLASWATSDAAILQGALAKGQDTAEPFRVTAVADENTSTRFVLGSDGVWSGPASLLNASNGGLTVRFYAPVLIYEPTIIPEPTGVTVNPYSVTDPANEQGVGFRNSTAWQAGTTYTIRFGTYGTVAVRLY